MALPYTMSPVSPFDVITSQAENEKIANIESLADGTGIDDGAVSTAKIADGAVTAPKIDFATLAFGNYSTTEQDTGFKWVDGKTIYQKTINFGTLPNATSKTVPHGVTGIDYLISISATAKAGTELRAIPHINPGTLAAGMSVYISGANLAVQTSADQTAYTTCYITICYTKS